VAVEDEHFYSDPVVNEFEGIARAGVATLHSRSDPGGSTIPQQLAKQLYGSGIGFCSTLAEVGLGLKLSFAFSHDQVLVMYLNAVTTEMATGGMWPPLAATSGHLPIVSTGLKRPCWPAFSRLRRPTIP
jgi:membrane peptidoglycan carboxypeptidase